MVEPSVKRVVLDVLKLREPSLPEFAKRLSSMKGVETVKVSLVEMDQDTESLKVAIYGNEIDIDSIQERLEEWQAVVHSIDEVSVGK